MPDPTAPHPSSADENTPVDAIVFKICPRATWQEALATGSLAPSADDARDGFIHLSTRRQLAGTLSRHFQGRTDLLLLAVDTARLPKGALAWEPSRGGELFPHLYAALRVDCVTSNYELSLDAEGRHRLPAALED